MKFVWLVCVINIISWKRDGTSLMLIFPYMFVLHSPLEVVEARRGRVFVDREPKPAFKGQMHFLMAIYIFPNALSRRMILSS